MIILLQVAIDIVGDAFLGHGVLTYTAETISIWILTLHRQTPFSA